MAFGIALSGLASAQTDLDVTANNIANSETTGFKGSRTEFSELFSSSLQGVSSLQPGNGVRVATIAQQFAQGNIQNSNNSLDMAVNGSGFFMVSDSGALKYTRAGSFGKDSDGYVVNSAGQRLQVYASQVNGGFATSTSDLQLAINKSPPKATTNAQTTFNLPSAAAVPATATFSSSDPTSYNNTTSVTVYDSLGAAHTATIYFVKTATPNQWSARMYMDGNAVGGAQTLQYSQTGAITTPTNGQVNFGTYNPTTTGAQTLNITFDFSKSTQYGSNFSVSNITQDGFTTGLLTGISVSGTGVVQSNFTNGQSIPLGQVALVNFSNPQGLQKLDGTNWAESFSSGPPILGAAGTAGFGQLQSGAVEASNVDVTKELVNMIVAQRNYSANAQMISAEKSITETIINMAR